MSLPKLGFAKRLLTLYSLVFVIGIALTDWSLSRVVAEHELDALKDSLARQSSLVANLVAPVFDRIPELQEQVIRFTEGTNIRATIIDAHGKVLADSSETPENLREMDNHASRPEIAAALRKETGVSIRYSLTLKTKMLYIAVPIVMDGSVRGVVRSAMPVSRVDETFASARKTIFTVAVFAILVILVTGLLFTRRLTRRIRQITRGAERYASEDWSEKVLIDGRDELKMLADTMNHMASILRHRIRDLESEKAKISAILSHMTDAVIAVNGTKEVVMANPMAEKLFGFSAAAALGKSLIEATRHPHLETIVDEAFLKGQTIAGEIQLISPAKKILRISVVITGENVRDIKGIIVFNDITEIRRLENNRKEFVANVSHELRTPLTSLKGFIETLLDGASRDPSTSERFLKMMQEDATRLGRLVEDMLTLGEIEQGALPLKKEALDLDAEIRAVVERFGPQLETKKILVEDQLGTKPLTVAGDRDKVRQVFVNLIDNAAKYSPENSKILLRADPNQFGITVSVEDTGPGIPADVVERVFERFFRVDKARPRDLGGTGLGLAIVKHIMEAHGGKITCLSKPGIGTRFTAFFPF